MKRIIIWFLLVLPVLGAQKDPTVVAESPLMQSYVLIQADPLQPLVLSSDHFKYRSSSSNQISLAALTTLNEAGFKQTKGETLETAMARNEGIVKLLLLVSDQYLHGTMMKTLSQEQLETKATELLAGHLKKDEKLDVQSMIRIVNVLKNQIYDRAETTEDKVVQALVNQDSELFTIVWRHSAQIEIDEKKDQDPPQNKAPIAEQNTNTGFSGIFFWLLTLVWSSK